MSDIEREPIRPWQSGTDVTEAMTGVRLDLEMCAICTRVRGVGDHHIIFRSAGGHEGPTLPACDVCHGRVHDREWTVVIEESGLSLTDREGQVIWRLQRWPLPGEPGEFVQLLDRVTQATKLMPEMAPALLPWQAAEVFRALKEVGEGGWRGQCRLAGELYRWRMPGLSGPEKVDALCGLFDLRRSQSYDLLQVASAFQGSDALEETPLSMGYAIEAARSTDPEKWLHVAEERKAEHKAYSRDDLKVEIIKAEERKWPASDVTPEGERLPPVQKRWGKCRGCSRVGWFDLLPVGSEE